MDRLKSLFSQGCFDERFIQAAKEELPYLWGRMSLLEEYYALVRSGGDKDRIPSIHDQLGRPRRFHGSTLRKLWAAITG